VPIAACVSLGNQITHAELSPRIVESARFKTALALLKLDIGEVDRWREKFRDNRDLIESMDRLSA
jgi:hypothetical protein